MKHLFRSPRLLLGLFASLMALILGAQPVMAQRLGIGFHGGWHGGGWHGGYGRGGWGWRGNHWHPWYPALGLGLGLYFATLPNYYNTYWYGGMPYYYADNTFYRWDGGARQYVTVAPPDPLLRQMPGTNAATRSQSDVIAYPKNGQSDAQLGKDKFECHKWAVGQTRFDPTQPAGGAAPSKREEYFRAQSACLEGRGYSVK